MSEFESQLQRAISLLSQHANVTLELRGARLLYKLLARLQRPLSDRELLRLALNTLRLQPATARFRQRNAQGESPALPAA
jgi:hypothetical protein